MSDTKYSSIDSTVDITQCSPEQYPMNNDPMVFNLTGGYDYSIDANVSVTGISIPWDTTTTTSDRYTLDPNWNNGISAKIRLDGPDADIEINGESLTDMLRNIEQRLNILKPNPELESEWAELKALGDAYRKLEADIEAKMKTWDAIAR